MIKIRSTGFRTWQACTGERFQLRVKKGLQSNRNSQWIENSRSNTEVTPVTSEEIFAQEQAEQTQPTTLCSWLACRITRICL